MKPKFNEQHRFMNQYTEADFEMYKDWIRAKKDINWCIGQIMIKDNISAPGAYKRLEKAAKAVGNEN